MLLFIYKFSDIIFYFAYQINWTLRTFLNERKDRVNSMTSLITTTNALLFGFKLINISYSHEKEILLIKF